MKALFSIFFMLLPLFGAKYSEMSTQELIAIMGYVEEEKKERFYEELKEREPSMSQEEKRRYEQRLKELSRDGSR